MKIKESEPAAAAGVLVRRGEGRSVQWGPSGLMRILAGADTTEGCFSICEVTEPVGSSAPLHVHHAEAEAFYILDGTIELTCGDGKVTAGAGDFVYTPKDVPHKYVVVGDRPARVLLLFSRPGFERFFIEGGTPVGQKPSGPPNPLDFQRLVAKYQMDLLEIPGH